MMHLNGININLLFKPNGDTYHGSIRQSLGGVGRNIADGLFRLGQHPVFLSAIGHDSYKGLLEMECSHMVSVPHTHTHTHTFFITRSMSSPDDE